MIFMMFLFPALPVNAGTLSASTKKQMKRLTVRSQKSLMRNLIWQRIAGKKRYLMSVKLGQRINDSQDRFK